MTLVWVLLGVGAVGCLFIVGYAVVLRNKYAQAAEAASLLRDRADECRAILDDWESRRGD